MGIFVLFIYIIKNTKQKTPNDCFFREYKQTNRANYTDYAENSHHVETNTNNDFDTINCKFYLSTTVTNLVRLLLKVSYDVTVDGKFMYLML